MKFLAIAILAVSLAACVSTATDPNQASCPATQPDGTKVSVNAGYQCDTVTDRLRK